MRLYLLLIVCCVPHHVLWPLDDDWSFWPYSCNPEAASPWSSLYSCCLPVSVKSTSTMELYCSLATGIERQWLPRWMARFIINCWEMRDVVIVIFIFPSIWTSHSILETCHQLVHSIDTLHAVINTKARCGQLVPSFWVPSYIESRPLTMTQ